MIYINIQECLGGYQLMTDHEKLRIRSLLLWKARNESITAYSIFMIFFAILIMALHTTTFGRCVAAVLTAIVIFVLLYLERHTERKVIDLVESGTVYEADINPGKTRFFMRRSKTNPFNNLTNHQLECFIYDDKNNRMDFTDTYQVPHKNSALVYDRDKFEEMNKKYDKVKLLVNLKNPEKYYIFHDELLGLSEKNDGVKNSTIYWIAIALLFLIVPYFGRSQDIADFINIFL